VERHPTLLARWRDLAASAPGGYITRDHAALLDSIATRLDEARDISRYNEGLLVFLGCSALLGLIETSARGKVIDGLKVGGDAGALLIP